MKKQFYINEVPVKRVSFQWTVWSDKGNGDNWLDTDDLTPRKLLNRMNNNARYEDFVIASIGFESFDYPDFTVEFKDDGAHLYVDNLTNEAIIAANQEYLDWEAEYDASRSKELEVTNIRFATPYRVCEGCGSHLDHGEACDCKNEAPQTYGETADKPDAGKEPTPEEMRNKALESVGITPERFEQVVTAARQLFDAVSEVVRKFIKALAPFFRKLYEAMLRTSCTNPKWWYYYRHAKKARVRKKYENRIRDACVAAMIESTRREVRLSDVQMC